MNLDSVLHIRLDAPNYSSDGIERAFKECGFDYHSVYWQQDRFNFGIQGLEQIILTKVKYLEPKHPDIIFLHIQNYSVITEEFAKELAKYSFVVNYTYDVREDLSWYIKLAPHIGLTLFSNMTDVKRMREIGFNNVDYLQVSADMELYSPYHAHKSNDYPEIVFIGNNFQNTAHKFPLINERKEMIDFLYRNYDRRFKAFGMNLNSRIINTPEETRDIYAACKIAISQNHFDYELYTSDRLFRIMACGAFCLTKHFDGIETMFEVGKHLHTWRTLDELKTKIDYFLSNDDARKSVAYAGMYHVRENHTWTKRIERLKEIINGTAN